MSITLRTVDRPTWDEIDAYFAGEADPHVRERVESYFARHPRIERVVRGYVAGAGEPWNVETMFQSIQGQLGSFSVPAQDDSTVVSDGFPGQRLLGMPWRWSTPLVSAGFSLILLFGVGLFLGLERIKGVTGAQEAPMLIYQTRNAQQSTATLSDGTRIVLNVASILKIPTDFGRENRTVQLAGEAYFQVAHKSTTPFIVKTHETETRVLGTEFGVNAYDSAHIRVAVRSGRVAVNQTVVGEQQVANVDSEGLVTVRQTAVDLLLGFADGKMVMNGVPLRDAIADLERWYDAEIRIADTALGSIALHAMLVNGNIDDLSDLFRLAFNARVERKGRVLTVHAPERYQR